MPIDPRKYVLQLRDLLRRSRRARWAAGALGALLLYTLCGFLLVPALLGHYLPQGVRESLGCELALGDVRFNPFTLQLNIDKAALTEGDGKPVFAAERLRVNLQLSGIVRRAWTLAELRLVRPELDVVIERDGRSNLERIVTQLPAPAATEEPSPSPRLLVQQLSLKEGALRLVDASLATPAQAAIGGIELRAEQLGTVPDAGGNLRFTATLPGEAALHADGAVRLGENSAELQLAVTGLEPGALWDFAAAQVRIAPPGGSLDAQARIVLSFANEAPGWRIEDLAATLRDVAMTMKQGDARAIELASLELAGGRIDSVTHSVELASLALRDGRLTARVDEHGLIDWSEILVPPAAAAGAAETPTWRVSLPSIEVHGLALDLRDASRVSPLKIGVDALGIHAAAELEIGAAEPVFRVRDAGARLAGVRVASADGAEQLARLDTLSAEDIDIDSTTARVELARLALGGLATGIERRADGSVRELEALATRADLPAPAADSATPAWQVAVREIALSGLAATLSDLQTEPALRYSVADGTLTVRGFDTAATDPLALELKLPLAEGGEIAATGTAAPDGSSADLELDLHELALQPLAPLVARETILLLADGTLSADTELHYRSAEQNRLLARGTVTIAQLQLNEAASGTPFMAWKSLKAKGIEFGLGPDQLAIEDIRIVDPAAKIVFDAERKLNLTQLQRGAAEPASESAGAQFPVSIERVRLKNGTVDFADYSLVLPFAAHIERFAGVARHVSTQPDSRTTLALTGRVGTQGEARAEGSLAPFAPGSFSDVTVSFRDIPTSSLSPYSATFAGRTIKSGDLDLDLEYKVDNGRLAGENRIVLENFALGEQVQSEQDMHLPLDLAIALLTDMNGRIDLEIPVSGDVGDPQFNYGHVVRQAIGNALAGIATAPFRALGSLLGGGKGAEAMGSVRFAAGSSDLAPRETVRLGELATALAARPKLGLTVRPAAELELDGAALRNAAVRREVAQQLEVELAADEEPGPIAADDAKTQRALEGIAEQRHGEQWLEAVATEFAGESEKPPERVVKALALIGRGGGDRAFYQRLFERLVAAEPEPQEGLAKLASERADAVAKELGKKGFAAERLAVGEPGKPAKTDQKRRTVSIALELGALREPAVARR